MVACLDNLVGVRGSCSDTTPDSVYYINDLSGIGILEADKTMDAEAQSAYDFLEGKIDLAGDIVVNDIRQYLNPRFRTKSILDQKTIGIFQDNLQVASSQATYLVGKTFDLQEGYYEIFINKIGLHVANTGTVNVFVYDLISNKLLDTIEVTTTSGQVSYAEVAKTYKAEGQRLNLFVGYLATFDSYKTNLSSGCTSCRNPYLWTSPYVHVNSGKILNSGNKVEENVEANSNNDGLSVTFSLNCSLEPFVCSIKQSLAQAIWYKAGALVAEEMEFSKRFNSVINLHRDDAAELRVRYEDRYRESMTTVLHNMKIPNHDCFSCNRRVKLQVNLP